MKTFTELDLSELDGFTAEILELVNDQYPKQAKVFLRACGMRLRRNMKKEYGKHKYTGNLYNGMELGKTYIYKGNEYQIRVSNKAPHAWLIEHGHWISNRYAETNKRARAFHIAGKEANNFNKDFIDLADKFVDKLLTKGFA